MGLLKKKCSDFQKRRFFFLKPLAPIEKGSGHTTYHNTRPGHQLPPLPLCGFMGVGWFHMKKFSSLHESFRPTPSSRAASSTMLFSPPPFPQPDAGSATPGIISRGSRIPYARFHSSLPTFADGRSTPAWPSRAPPLGGNSPLDIIGPFAPDGASFRVERGSQHAILHDIWTAVAHVEEARHRHRIFPRDTKPQPPSMRTVLKMDTGKRVPIFCAPGDSVHGIAAICALMEGKPTRLYVDGARLNATATVAESGAGGGDVDADVFFEVRGGCASGRKRRLAASP